MDHPHLAAVIFDVDGTLAETERHGHRVAFNRAFEQKGFPFRWSDDLYRELVKVTGGTRRITHYLVNYQGMDPEQAGPLAAELHRLKTDLFVKVVEAAEIPARAGVVRFMSRLEQAGMRIAVATTGTRNWVHPLVEQIRQQAGLAPYAAVVTGDEVENLKPAPDAFILALERLQLAPGDVVIIEDSGNGVRSAMATGSGCIAVKGEYAQTADLQGADLVVDGYGDPDAPLSVLSNPLDLEVGEMLTPQVAKQIHQRRIAG